MNRNFFGGVRGLMALFAAMMFCHVASAQTQPWPARAVRIVVGFPAGGTNDVVARLIAEWLTARLGQTFVVDNRPGAGGNIGADMVAKAAPDGYTLALASNGALATNRFLYKSMPFDADNDFTPIVLVGEIPILFVANPKTPVADLGSLVDQARAHPDTLNAGSPGNGTIGHLALIQFNTLTGAAVQHVPYKGTAPAMTDLLGGTIELMVSPAVGLVEQIQSGSLKAIAVTSGKRMDSLPEVPTAIEQGFDMEASSLIGLFGPVGLPAPIVQRINDEVNRYIASPEGRLKLSAAGLQVDGGSPQHLADVMAQDVQRWTKVVSASGTSLTQD